MEHHHSHTAKLTLGYCLLHLLTNGPLQTVTHSSGKGLRELLRQMLLELPIALLSFRQCSVQSSL